MQLKKSSAEVRDIQDLCSLDARISTLEGRDEKGCLLSTKKKATVDVDHRSDSSFLLVNVSKLFLVDVDQTALFQPVYGPRSSMSVDMSISVNVHFTTLFIPPQ